VKSNLIDPEHVRKTSLLVLDRSGYCWFKTRRTFYYSTVLLLTLMKCPMGNGDMFVKDILQLLQNSEQFSRTRKQCFE